MPNSEELYEEVENKDQQDAEAREKLIEAERARRDEEEAKRRADEADAAAHPPAPDQ